mmetsp:Transcript_32504/g.80675  ORF Transcript_32504/g.80675 Transcript_32504/m.80675 type:complete len:311 (-) Transcript_32504:274-1206(-)
MALSANKRERSRTRATRPPCRPTADLSPPLLLLEVVPGGEVAPDRLARLAQGLRIIPWQHRVHRDAHRLGRRLWEVYAIPSAPRRAYGVQHRALTARVRQSPVDQPHVKQDDAARRARGGLELTLVFISDCNRPEAAGLLDRLTEPRTARFEMRARPELRAVAVLGDVDQWAKYIEQAVERQLRGDAVVRFGRVGVETLRTRAAPADNRACHHHLWPSQSWRHESAAERDARAVGMQRQRVQLLDDRCHAGDGSVADRRTGAVRTGESEVPACTAQRHTHIGHVRLCGKRELPVLSLAHHRCRWHTSLKL